MKLDISMSLAIDRNKISVFAEGSDFIDADQAEELSKKFSDVANQLRLRREPPAPSPFIWEKGQESFAECYVSKEDAENCIVSLVIGGHEFYLKDVKRLRDWCDGVLQYYGKDIFMKELERK